MFRFSHTISCLASAHDPRYRSHCNIIPRTTNTSSLDRTCPILRVQETSKNTSNFFFRVSTTRCYAVCITFEMYLVFRSGDLIFPIEKVRYLDSSNVWCYIEDRDRNEGERQTNGVRARMNCWYVEFAA